MSVNSQFNSLAVLAYSQAQSIIQSGDILLCSGQSLFSQMIQNATNSMWSHVGLLLKLPELDQMMVLESVETIGVRAVPLSSYLGNYNGSGAAYQGKLVVGRHQQFQTGLVQPLAKTAVNYLGYPYNTEEILRIAARIGMNGFGFSKDDDDIQPQKEFICSEYVHKCLQSVGINVSYDPLGFIAPADFASCPDIAPVAYLQD